MKLLIYLFFPILTIILFFFSRDTEIPKNVKLQDGVISRELFRISLFIFRKLHRKNIPGSEKVRANLIAMNDSKDSSRILEEYYAHKISVMLLLTLAGSFLSLMLQISDAQNDVLKDGNILLRPGHLERQQEMVLVANGESGTLFGEFEIKLNQQCYTKQEADDLFERASETMEKEILGENDSLSNVTNDLVLKKELDGYPFEISWQSDNYEIVSYDGKLSKDMIPEDGAFVELTATYKYDGYSWQQVFYASIRQEALSPEQQIRHLLEKKLVEADEASKYNEDMSLPGEYENEEINWSIKSDDSSMVLLMLMLVAGCGCFVLKDKELQQKLDKRNKQMISDYPILLSQLVLYLGAGMTVRNVFSKLASAYAKKREAGSEVHFMYEELTKCVRELSMGKSESEVYDSFGKRCQSQEYTRLCALLSQNLKKGNGEILRLLQEEASKAFNERMDNVRKLGEEAGTKLLVPMILMLIIVMVIIMIPAYMTF